MCYDSNRKPTRWYQEAFEKLKQQGCGLINCGSRLRVHNPVREEIQQILDDRFRDRKDSGMATPGLHTERIK